MLNVIRDLIKVHGRLRVEIDTLRNDEDLFAAGLTSFAAVQLMLALEERFDVEFSEAMMNKRSFASVDVIAGCLERISAKAA